MRQVGVAATGPKSELLPAGVKAPDFSLVATPDRKPLRLGSLLGAPVVLVFYPADWSPVCTDQLALYNELQSEFAKFKARVLGISVDGIWSHLAFAKDRGLQTIVLLADFEPKGAVARLYGAYDKTLGESERALFVIDAGGQVAWSYLSPSGINPGADGILTALEGLGKEER